MPDISSPNLAGITDMQVLNALRVIQANIEALAKALPDNAAEKGSVGTLRNELYQLQSKVDNLKVSYSGTNGIYAGPVGTRNVTLAIDSTDFLKVRSDYSSLGFGVNGGFTFLYSPTAGGAQDTYFATGPNHAVTYQIDANTPCGMYARNPVLAGKIKATVTWNAYGSSGTLDIPDFGRWVMESVFLYLSDQILQHSAASQYRDGELATQFTNADAAVMAWVAANFKPL